MNKELFELIKNKFLAKLSKKNSWGKNEVELLYSVCAADAMVEYIDILQQKNDNKKQ